MNVEVLNDIILNYKNKPNKQLLEAITILGDEFVKTKELIVNLTLHLENVEKAYENVNQEYKLRTKK